MLDPERVQVLIRSRELQRRYGEAAVAVLFPWGEGEVFHMISHYYLQRTEFRNARHRSSAAGYYAEKGLGFNDEDEARVRGLSLGDVESAAGSLASDGERDRGQEARRREASPGQDEGGQPMNPIAEDPIAGVRELLTGGLSARPARQAGPLTLVPLVGGMPGPKYLTAAAALEAGALSIGEIDGGSVPQLTLKNVGTLPVLLLDGEHLEGAMQNRVLNATVLAAPEHETVIPVSCVEQGRWGYRSSSRSGSGFTPAPEMAYAELRAMKAETVAASARRGAGRRADQGAVWADVERKRAQVQGA